MWSREADVSVVIPLYNHEKYITVALEGVFNQTVYPREIIVVDDGSSDRSFQLVKEQFGNRENLIFWSKPNLGAHHTINAGIHRSTSSYVAILNSDDIYEPDRLQICLQMLDQNKDAQIACTGISFIDGLGKKVKNMWYEQALKYYQSSGDLALSLINGNFLMTTSNFVIRRSIFEKIGYFSNFRYVHDLDFLLRLLANNGKICINPKPLLRYRTHSSNTISEGVLKVKVELAVVIAYYLMETFHSHSGHIPADYLMKLYSVLDTHNLSRMLFPLMGMLASNTWNSPDKLIADPEILQTLLAIAK